MVAFIGMLIGRGTWLLLYSTVSSHLVSHLTADCAA